jgi:hypothetical protein
MAEALIAAAPAAAWPANTLSPSGLPPPTIAATGGERQIRGDFGLLGFIKLNTHFISMSIFKILGHL